MGDFMDGYELIDFEEIENNLVFTKKVIEYFKNDYLLIVDFLENDSVWDNSFMLMFKCDKETLHEYKGLMVDNIINVYETVVMSTIQKQTEVNEPFSSVDGPYLDYLNKKELPITILFNDDFCAIQMIRYFINILNYKYDIKIDTYNTFKYDILEILRIYEELANRVGIDRLKLNIDESLEQNYLIFFQYLYKNLMDYINNCFRNDEERKYFVNYLCSIGYAYLKDLELYDDEYSEEDELFMFIMNSDENLFDKFCNDQSLASYVIELLFQCYKDYQLGYDLRKKIDEQVVQDMFESLDDNYNTEYDEEFIINTCDLDYKLSNMLKALKQDFNNEDIYNILLNNIATYKYLIEQGLDARYSEYYKKQIILKIIVDVFEYEVYKKSIDSDYQMIHYEFIKNLKSDDKTINEYFINEGYSLLELYYEYHNEIVTYHEKARKEVYNSNNLETINNLNNFSMFNYFGIDNLNCSLSVDYLNSIFDRVKAVVSTNNLEILSDENTDLLINTLCMNIYMNILLSTELDLNDKKFLSIIDNNDIIKYININPGYLFEICNLFIKYNNNYLSYSKESRLKRKIEDPEKIKKIEKFDKFND